MILIIVSTQSNGVLIDKRYNSFALVFLQPKMCTNYPRIPCATLQNRVQYDDEIRCGVPDDGNCDRARLFVGKADDQSAAEGIQKLKQIEMKKPEENG